MRFLRHHAVALRAKLAASHHLIKVQERVCEIERLHQSGTKVSLQEVLDVLTPVDREVVDDHMELYCRGAG
jgi:hypothetical protein